MVGVSALSLGGHMKARLALYIGDQLAWGVPIGVRDTTIGREDDNSIRLDDPRVSRHHAVVRSQGAGWLVEDLVSTNGVSVNGVPVKQAELRPGDMVSVGSYDLSFEVIADDADWEASRPRGGASQRRRATLTGHRDEPQGPATTPL
jgi:pSer/pThr/pTyr-binding forkhead associated (FHA) protein